MAIFTIKEFCIFNLVDKNNYLNETIFNTFLLIKYQESLKFKDEFNLNVKYKIANKILENHLKFFEATINLFIQIKDNSFVEIFIKNYKFNNKEKQNKQKNQNKKIEKIDQNEISNNNDNDSENLSYIEQENSQISLNFTNKKSEEIENSENNSSLLNLDCSFSLKDNNSMINITLF